MRPARLRDSLVNSLWLIPMLFVVSGAGLALITLAIDKAADYDLVSQALTGPPAAAQTILTTFIASLVTLISIVMTVITVAVQLAMQQFSPRIVRPLLQDRRNQCMVGLFAATLVFSLIVVPQAYGHEGGQGSGLPGLSILTAEVLMLASVIALILYVHQAGQAMRVSGLIDLVGDQTRAMIKATYPEPNSPLADVAGEDVIASPEAGAVYRIEYDALVEEALRAEIALELVPAMGDFVATGAPLVRVHGEGGSRLDHEKIKQLVWLGGERSHTDDPAYGLRKLVDIAERGLAEPFEDPTTTVMAIDRIHDVLRMLVNRDFPDGRYSDESGELRLTVPVVGWDDYVWLAFTELRVAGAGSPQVPRRIRAAIDDLLEVAPPDRRPPLERQLQLLDALVEQEYDEGEQIDRAQTSDRQGIGSPGSKQQSKH
jgi:uncharacterized membrane protein